MIHPGKLKPIYINPCNDCFNTCDRSLSNIYELTYKLVINIFNILFKRLDSLVLLWNQSFLSCRYNLPNHVVLRPPQELLYYSWVLAIKSQLWLLSWNCQNFDYWWHIYNMYVWHLKYLLQDSDQQKRNI